MAPTLYTHDVFDLLGTAEEQRMAHAILQRGTFPWYVVLPGLKQRTGRTKIPVSWEDLSRFGVSSSGALVEEAAHSHEHSHEHGDTHTHEGHDGHGHSHSHEEGVHAVTRVVNGRLRVLGLAYYSGRVVLEKTLISNPELAAEVFFSEGAHMIDFFFMTDRHRVGIWNAFHVNDKAAQLPLNTVIKDGVNLHHGHGWFDVGGYYSWVGEALMALIVLAYSDVRVTIKFDHPVTPAVLHAGRNVLTPVSGTKNTKYFHRNHPRARNEIYWASREDAIRAGRVRCRFCRP